MIQFCFCVYRWHSRMIIPFFTGSKSYFWQCFHFVVSPIVLPIIFASKEHCDTNLLVVYSTSSHNLHTGEMSFCSANDDLLSLVFNSWFGAAVRNHVSFLRSPCHTNSRHISPCFFHVCCKEKERSIFTGSFLDWWWSFFFLLYTKYLFICYSKTVSDISVKTCL